MTTTTRSRPFTLLDALTLVAATALGFAVTRSLADFEAAARLDIIDLRDGPKRTAVDAAYSPAGTPPSPRVGYAAYWAQRAALWPCPCLAAWTAATLGLALVPPRPSGRRLRRRPGVVAGTAWAAGFFASAVASPQVLVDWDAPAAFPSLHRREWWAFTWFSLSKAAGLAVALSWLVLAASGRWAADRGWVDRLGRGLGAGWVGLGLVSLLSAWLGAL